MLWYPASQKTVCSQTMAAVHFKASVLKHCRYQGTAMQGVNTPLESKHFKTSLPCSSFPLLLPDGPLFAGSSQHDLPAPSQEIRTAPHLHLLSHFPSSPATPRKSRFRIRLLVLNQRCKLKTNKSFKESSVWGRQGLTTRSLLGVSHREQETQLCLCWLWLQQRTGRPVPNLCLPVSLPMEHMKKSLWNCNNQGREKRVSGPGSRGGSRAAQGCPSWGG